MTARTLAALSLATLLLAILALGCECNERRRADGGGAAPSSGPAASFGAARTVGPPRPTEPPTQEPPPPAAKAEPEAPAAATPLTTRFSLGPLEDVGPAAPMTATERGIVFVSRESRLYLAPRDGRDGFVPLKAPRELFSRYGRGPALGQRHAYFISPQSELLRGDLDTGETIVLATDARYGARVSAITVSGRDLVGYIAGNDEEVAGFLWAEAGSAGGNEILKLTPEGAQATSITLVPGDPHPHAVLLEGRTGMSPLHLRNLRVTQRRVIAEPDEVVWVGPGSHSLTELTSLSGPKDQVFSFIATARDVTHFGLALLGVDGKDPAPVEPTWRPYPNGLDPAPVATAHLCGGDFALFAVPATEKPRSPQDLLLAPITEGHLGQEEVLAHARAFNDLSLAPVKGGAIVAWTADHRTWAMVVGCPK